MLSAIAGDVYREEARFRQLLAAAWTIRRTLGLVSTLLVGPVLVLLLTKAGATLPMAGVLTLLGLSEVWTRLSEDVLIVVPRMHANLRYLINLDVFTAIGRLGAIAFAMLIWHSALYALIASLMVSLIRLMDLRRHTKSHTQCDRVISQADQRLLRRTVVSQFPNNLLFAFQGQATNWLIASFGNISAIADVGALSRFGAISAATNSVINNVVGPAAARSRTRNEISRLYSFTIGAIAVGGAVVVAVTAWRPSIILRLLGNQYLGLQHESVLMMLGVALNVVSASLWSINAARAWFPPGWLNCAIFLILQGALIGGLDLSTVSGVLKNNIFLAAGASAVSVIFALRGLKRTPTGTVTR
jgi:hypothetical protein